jgi:hypothetical protein
LLKEHPSGQIEVYRGIKGAQIKKLGTEEEVDLGVHALSSWSTHVFTAQEFAGKKGAVLKTTISISDVWATGEHAMEHQLMRMADQHGEIVVLSSDKSRRVHVVR